jgi:hypothetical protein
MMHRLQVLIPGELDALLNKASQRGRISKGEWVRRALESAVRAPDAGSDPITELAAIGAPAADIDVMLAEIENGRV